MQIYYDKGDNTSNRNYYIGRIWAIALQNLISHFPDIQQYIIPVNLYQKGQLERCDANFYIGSYHQAQTPKDFIDDFVSTKKNVAWINYHIQQLSSAQLQKLWNVTFDKVASADWHKKDSSGRPGVYNFFDYKGQTFERCNEASILTDSKKIESYYNNSFDINILKPLSPITNNHVISWARYTTENKRTPYILRKGNHWYIADAPFQYICEGDRYFIFADILFDILNEQPQDGGKKYALIRYEDVSPKQTPTNITRIADMFKELNIPFAISLIPAYRDPFDVYKFGQSIEMTDKKTYLTALHYAKDQGASFILHGVTHQYDHIKNPFSGVSGEDFEFWDQNQNKALTDDSVDFVLNRLNIGISLVKQSGFTISAWVTPHYLASTLDNVIFGRVFSWSVSRGNYVIVKICNLPKFNVNLTYDAGSNSEQSISARHNLLKNLRVIPIGYSEPMAQLFPYPIYGDYYRRNIIPENLGNIQPFFNTQVIAKRNVDQIIKDAKRYSVLRETWASLFIHDILLNTGDLNGIAKTPGDTSELRRMIQAIKNDGYEFIDLEKWTKDHANIKSPEPIEIDPPGGTCAMTD